MFGDDTKYIFICSHDNWSQGFCAMNICQKYSNKEKETMRTCMRTTRVEPKGESTKSRTHKKEKKTKRERKYGWLRKNI
jgi:hypothetical protein